MHLRSIRRRYTYCALLLALSILCTVWLDPSEIGSSILWSLVIVFLVGLFILQSQKLQTAKLIWDNRILAVQSALISMSGRQMEKDMEETVVSTFGMLIGSKIYRWGLEGVHGVRLHAAQMDKERMYLTFGDAAQTMRVELLHGMTQKQAVLDAAQKLWHETGVRAEITGW